MVKRLIGTGTTGTDGSVTIPYTGIGAGIMDLQVETEIGGETVSQNFSITDCLIYDSGINDGQKNTDVTIGTNVTEQVSNEGTTLECTNGTSLVTAQYTYNSIIRGDFETIITVTSATRILMGFYSGNDSSRILLNNVENRKYKFKRVGSVLTAQYYNGSEWVELSWYNNSLGTKNCRFYMYLYADNTTNTVTFKDMEVLNGNENVLIVDASSNIVQSGDVLAIEGRLYRDSILAKNTVLDVYKNGAMVGTANTGSTGVASYSYTGVGVGETEFYFKYGSIVSGTYNVIDGILAFDGTSVTSNFRTVTNITLSVEDNFVKIAQSGTNKWQTFTVNGQNTGWLDPSNNYRVEFDYIAPTTDYSVFSLCGSAIRLNNGSANEEHHIKIEQVNGVINAYLDNNPTPYVTVNVGTSTDASFGLFSIEYLKIKNFVIYPI